jgi:hypothetical protein
LIKISFSVANLVSVSARPAGRSQHEVFKWTRDTTPDLHKFIANHVATVVPVLALIEVSAETNRSGVINP